MDKLTALFESLGLSGVASLVNALIIFLLCAAAIRILSGIVCRLLDKSRRIDGNMKSFAKTALKIVLWALAILTVADSLGIPTASLVAALSVVGLALSLAVQNVAANVFSGITLLVTKPFDQGDYCDIGSNSGTVKSVGLFYTVLDSPDRRVITIPNSDVTAAAIVNYSREPMRRVELKFSASYDSPTGAVRTAIMEAAADERIAADPAPQVLLTNYSSSAIEYALRFWCRNSDYWDLYFQVNERVRETFAKHGVEMSYEHVNVHIVEK